MATTFEVTNGWKSTFPEARAGVLVMRGVANIARHEALESEKTRLVGHIRGKWAAQDRSAMLEQPVLKAYQAYYRRFDKTYHVQLQLESIAFKGRSLPSVSGLVDAMFMAEVRNLLLTAGHDLTTVRLPIRLDVSQGDEHYTVLRGQEQVLKPDDMMMVDRTGVISSILYGPDQRTQITSATQDVVYTVYAPAGIGVILVRQHLETIQEYVKLFAPEGHTEYLEVFPVD